MACDAVGSSLHRRGAELAEEQIHHREYRRGALREEMRRRNPVRIFLGFVAGSIPTLLVLALAGAVGWWGHHSGWKLPKFSQLNGMVKEKDDWCAEHNVPESACVECDPSLMPRAERRGWCNVHGIPECTRKADYRG